MQAPWGPAWAWQVLVERRAVGATGGWGPGDLRCGGSRQRQAGHLVRPLAALLSGQGWLLEALQLPGEKEAPTSQCPQEETPWLHHWARCQQRLSFPDSEDGAATGPEKGP